MKAKILTFITWLFYAGLIYTAFNPAHEYMSYLDNTRTLYLIVNIPLILLLGSIAGLIYIGKNFAVKGGLDKAKSEQAKNPEEFKKTMENLKNIETKHRFLIPFSRFVTIVTAFVTFIILGDAFLGTVMIIGTAFSHLLMTQLKSFAKEVLNAVE